MGLCPCRPESSLVGLVDLAQRMVQRMLPHPSAGPLSSASSRRCGSGARPAWRPACMPVDLNELVLRSTRPARRWDLDVRAPALVPKERVDLLVFPSLFFFFPFYFLSSCSRGHHSVPQNTPRHTTSPAACPNHLQVQMKVFRQIQKAPTLMARTAAR